MNKALDLHNESSAKAFLAIQAKRKNNFDEFLELTKEAFRFEKEAALELKDSYDSEPTRSVLFRSAATLASNCGEYDQAIKLIGFALIGEPPEEIRIELIEVLQRMAKEKELALSNSKQNAYLEFLRDKAINIKIEPRTIYYSKAIAVDSILEALRNVRTSILNYIEVNFKRDFSERDFSDYNKVLEVVKRDYSPLCVNLSFSSFGASISVDDTIMGKEYNRKILKWKENLFNSYKTEVIDIDYESTISLKEIVNKYSDEERNLIYNPIVDSLKEKNKYKVAITDKYFKHIEKTLKPISKPAQELLIPKTQKEIESKSKILIQSYALGEDSEKFQKRDIFASYEMDYAEFSRLIEEVTFEKEYLVVRNPYQLKIIYRRPDFIIEDTVFEIYTSSQTFPDVIKNYNKNLINFYKDLTTRDPNKLSVDEIDMKERLGQTFTFASRTS